MLRELRASEWDLRRNQPYEIYDELEFDIPIGLNSWRML